MRFPLILLITTLIQTWGTSVYAQNYTIEKVRDIPLDLGDEIAGEIADLTLDAEGNFYLPDWQQHTVWVTNPQGEMIRRVGQKGAGPGELSKPQTAVVLQDRIVVLDKENIRVASFSLDGVHQATFRVDLFRTANMVCGRDGRIAVSSLDGESLFTVYDAAGNKSHEAGSRPWPPDPPIPVMIGGSFHHLVLTPEGRILYSPVKSYEVLEMEWDGSIVATYRAEPPGYFPMVITSMESREDDINKASMILRPLVVGEHVLVQRQRIGPENVGKLRIDLFERDGTLVQMDIESPVNFVYADGDDLYAIDTTPVDEGELNPSIVVYQLKN